MINIALDGPSGAGKSTLAKDLAKKLGCTKQNLFQKVRRNDMRYSDLEEICNQLGIEIKFLKDGKEITY